MTKDWWDKNTFDQLTLGAIDQVVFRQMGTDIFSYNSREKFSYSWR